MLEVRSETGGRSVLDLKGLHAGCVLRCVQDLIVQRLLSIVSS